MILADRLAVATNEVMFEQDVLLEPFDVLKTTQFIFKDADPLLLYDPRSPLLVIYTFDVYAVENPTPLDVTSARAELTLVDGREVCGFAYSCTLHPVETSNFCRSHHAIALEAYQRMLMDLNIAISSSYAVNNGHYNDMGFREDFAFHGLAPGHLETFHKIRPVFDQYITWMVDYEFTTARFARAISFTMSV